MSDFLTVYLCVYQLAVYWRGEKGGGGCRVFTSGGRVEGEEGGGGGVGVGGWVSLLLSPAQSSCLTLRLILEGRFFQ